MKNASKFSLLHPAAFEGESASYTWGDNTITDLVPRTYKIKPGPPKGLSYAKGIAVRYGISFEQLAGRWQERQQVPAKK